MKIVNCAILFIGLQLGFRNIDKRPQDVMTMRKFMLVITSFVVWGGLALLIVAPGAAYLATMKLAAVGGAAEAGAVLAESSGTRLFAGVTNQSQCLAAVLPCSLAWLACDMFFIEKRISPFHVWTILAGLPLVYMTRSRIALLAFVASAILIYFYSLRKINIRPHIRARLRSAMISALFLVGVAAVVMEVRNQTITKWIRKTEDLSSDTRGVGEAFTASRQGKVEENMADFRRNPMFGSGFQVTEEMQYRFQHHEGLIFSAPIEKSILPLMVLGETGVVGGIVFSIYILAFYAGCLKRRYYCCATLHTIFLVTNMAEGSYFSPGGMGGYLWVLCVGGGFIIDTVVLYHRRLEKIVRRQQLEMIRMSRF